MSAKIGNRVKETTDTTGTGTLDLDGAPTGFRSFADEFTSGDDNVSYLIVDDPDSPTEYEYGKGTFTSGTPNTLARDTVEGSSNSGSKVSWSAGTKTVIGTPTAADFNSLLAAGGWGTKSAKTRAITSSGNQVAADDGKTILADSSGSSPPTLTYTLLAAATAGDGFFTRVKNQGGSTVIDGNGAETIDGAATLTLSVADDEVGLLCDGSAWHVVGAAIVRGRTLGAGFAATPYNAGTKSSGTFTPDEADGNFQYATNNGAHTLAPPSNNVSIVIQYTNGASAGAITTSGFTKVTGGTITTTNGDDFLFYITKVNGFSHLHVQALQ